MNQRKMRTGEELPESHQPATSQRRPGCWLKITELSRRQDWRAPLPGQGVGAWSWVSRNGARRVMDRDLAVDFTGFTLFLDQPGACAHFASET